MAWLLKEHRYTFKVTTLLTVSDIFSKYHSIVFNKIMAVKHFLKAAVVVNYKIYVASYPLTIFIKWFTCN